MTDEQRQQLLGYLDSSIVEAISYPFAFGPKNEPCLCITSTAGGWRYIDVIFPNGSNFALDSYSLDPR